MLTEQSSFRQSMSWLHTWAGLVLSWLLFFIFITGTAGYFDTEIDLWMQPEIQQQALLSKTNLIQTEMRGENSQESLGLTASEQIVKASIPRLQQQASEAAFWRINLPIDRNQPWTSLYWRGDVIDSGSERFSVLENGPLVARDTGGGQLLYKMHWKLHYMPIRMAEWIVGLATVLMLLALLTGIVVHKRIFKDFFTFRQNKSLRSWLDAHNLLSVPALPFYLMITYSGLVFMASTYMPFPIVANYGLSEQGVEQFYEEVFSDYPIPEASDIKLPLYPVYRLLQQADSYWGKEQVKALEVHHPGDKNARVILWEARYKGPLRQSRRLVFDGVTGELLQNYSGSDSPVKDVRNLLLGLHEGGFAEPLLRWLYFLSGLAGSAMIATGSLLWCVKRRKRYAKEGRSSYLGLQLMERLNAGIFLGLPIAIAVYFWANRLLPVDFANRAVWEVNLLFLSWFLLLTYAAFRPLNRLWHELLSLAAIAYIGLPMINGLTTNRGLWLSWEAQDWLFVAFDLTLCFLGGLFLLGQCLLWRKQNAGKLNQTIQASRSVKVTET